VPHSNQSDLSEELTEHIPPRLGGVIVCCLSLPNSLKAGTLSILSSAISPAPRTFLPHRRCSYIQIDPLTVTPNLQNIPLVFRWKIRFYTVDNPRVGTQLDPMNDLTIYIYILFGIKSLSIEIDACILFLLLHSLKITSLICREGLYKLYCFIPC